MNRLKEFLEEPAEREPEGDYYTVDTRSESFVVSRATAAEVERVLDEVPFRGWTVFTDLAGARHRLRTRLIERVSECTEAQRAAERAFHRARRLEAKADHRPWEEND